MNNVPYFWTGQFFKWVEKLTTYLWGHTALNTEMSESIETAVKKTSIIYCTCFTTKTSWQIVQWLAFLSWKLHSALGDSLKLNLVLKICKLLQATPYLNQPLLPTAPRVETDWKIKLDQSHMICVQKVRVKRDEHYTV